MNCSRSKCHFFLPLLFLLVLFFLGCRHRLQTGGGHFPGPDLPDPGIVWGLGDTESAAKAQPLFTDAGMEIISHWFTGPEDWQWGYESSKDQKKIREHYDNGRSIQIIVWLADYE